MKTSYNRKSAVLATACALALTLLSGTAAAQVPAPLASDHMLLRDASGQVVVSQFGDCWHSGFGPAPASTAQCDPNYRAPAPIAQSVAPAAPAPAPYAAPVVVAAAPVAAVYEKVRYDANVLFDFDKSVLRQAGRDTLDDFVARTRHLVEPGSLFAIGYADRIGSDGYNQKLSEARVATVKAYLVSKGLQADRVSTSGRGESQPTTRSECDGPTNARSIACLQPDRHVYIELTGSQIKK
jgi:OmpA-OmpF porin, OOP family